MATTVKQIWPTDGQNFRLVITVRRAPRPTSTGHRTVTAHVSATSSTDDTAAMRVNVSDERGAPGRIAKRSLWRRSTWLIAYALYGLRYTRNC